LVARNAVLALTSVIFSDPRLPTDLPTGLISLWASGGQIKMIREITARQPKEGAVCTENPIRFPLLALSAGLNLTGGNEVQLQFRFMEDKGPVKTVVTGLGDRDSLLWEERRIRDTGRITTKLKPLSAPGCNALGSGRRYRHLSHRRTRPSRMN
jgi:hypothetical protein